MQPDSPRYPGWRRANTHEGDTIINEYNGRTIADDVILSVHLPKAAGITLATMFRQAFPDALVDDYPDRDPWRNAAAEVRVIHGHFELEKYIAIAPAPRVVTFLREPLGRAISHFNFWASTDIESAKDHPLFAKYFLEQRPDLERFLLAPELANLMSSFLKPFDRPEQFWFVGLQEHFAADAACLQRMLGLPVTPLPVANETARKSKVDIDPEVKRRFYEIHSEDKRLYDDMLAFRQRCVARCRHYPDADIDGGIEDESLRDRYNRLAAAYGEVINSRSWKITGPLRLLSKALRRSGR